MATILTAVDLTVRYNERTILDTATLAIEDGDHIGLVGRNGCGKTTFLKILAGRLKPDSGQVTPRRNLVTSYLPQDFTLDPALDVRGNVREGARHVMDLIAEFENLPAESNRHEEIRTSHPDAGRLDARPAHRNRDVAPELSARRTQRGVVIRRRKTAGRAGAGDCFATGFSHSRRTDQPSGSRVLSNGSRIFWRISAAPFWS